MEGKIWQAELLDRSGGSVCTRERIYTLEGGLRQVSTATSKGEYTTAAAEGAL